jgi:hypothetical protein
MIRNCSQATFGNVRYVVVRDPAVARKIESMLGEFEDLPDYRVLLTEIETPEVGK